ncbi:pyridoxal phosphate-dependent aminotransferase [Parasporobacterium paucivorans]|uniref:Aminotransferase n=1 Tax=Parasporobacterium paucivorans DSM 15970 TaxID=1122934 RepID=A0A1M6F8M5_9FIRM|nr:pyridoxal phosphate-dependent aminotransferase [Parasporobacterium paucivorans]SHI94057.1 L-aspartate aminotransferase apoenzyme [Parasporobacterium paucivorans DSM 15970]
MSLEFSRKALEVKPSSTLAITAKSKELKSKGLDIVGFVAGEPDYNTPDYICEAAITSIREGFTKYTNASGMPELKAAISEKFKADNNLEYKPDQIVISNGGKHSLTNIFTALLNPGDEVIIPVPYWLSYPEIVRLASGVPVFVKGEKLDGFKVTPEKLQAVTTDKTKVLVLNSPNNPTGMMYSRDELQAIADYAVKNNIYVISDEIYEKLTYGDNKHISIASLGNDIYERTITVNGLSKSYAMTGWRIGFTGSSLAIAKLMSGIQSHQTSNPNSIAQKAAIAALEGDQQPVLDMKNEFEERKKLIYRLLGEIDYLSALEPQGAFYLFVDLSGILDMKYKGETLESAAKVARILIEDFLLAVIPCADFGAPEYMRLSYAISREQIEKGMGRIADFVKSLEK